MEAKFFEVDGLRFVAGLYWVAVNDPDRWRREVREVAADEGANAGVLRYGSHPQAGLFAAQSKGDYRHAALAAIIAKTLTDQYEDVGEEAPNYLVAIELPDGQGCYVTGGFEGTIIATLDSLYEQPSKARTEFLGYHDDRWDLIICPDHWGVEGSVEYSVTDFIPRDDKDGLRSHGWWYPTPLAGTGVVARLGRVAGLAAVLSAVGVGGWYGYDTFFARNGGPLPPVEKVPSPVAKPRPRDKPWADGLVTTAQLTRHCKRAIGRYPLFIAGWSLASVQCEPDAVTAVYSRADNAPIPGLEAVFDKARIDWRGGATSASVTRGHEIAVQSVGKPPSADVFWRAYQHRAYATEALELSESPYPARETNDGTPIPPPPGTRYEVIYTGATVTSGLWSGLVCEGTTVEYRMFSNDSGVGEWTIEGTCYAL